MEELFTMSREQIEAIHENFSPARERLDPSRERLDPALEQLNAALEQFDGGHSTTPLAVPSRRGFLWRQFSGSATRRQKTFDVLVGILLPVLCLFFDPVVFRGGILGPPLLGRLRLFAYAVIALEIAALSLWLALGERVREWGGMLGGAMLAGAAFSFVTGVTLLPYSIVGLLLLIGVLGFSPFLAAFVCLRNAARTLKASKLYLGAWRRTLALTLGATLALGAPAFAHLKLTRAVNRAMGELVGGDDARTDAATRTLRLAGWVGATDFDDLARAYEREGDAARKQRLARVYRELTGQDVEQRLRMLND